MARNLHIEVLPTGQHDHSTADIDVPIDNPDCSGALLTIDVTDENPDGSAGAMVVAIQAVDKTSGKKGTILASATINAIGTTRLRVGRALTASANLVANDALPPNININVADVANVHPMVYSIGLDLIA